MGIRAHRGLAAFAAGVLLTLSVLGAAAYLVLADQQRSARLLAATLSRALAREVRIERVTEVGTARVVMRGVRLARSAGWPVDVSAETVEATGPLLAVVRGEAAPLRLIVTRPTVEIPAGGTAPAPPGLPGLPGLNDLRRQVTALLGGPMLLDLTLEGGVARQGGGRVEFDLVLRTGPGEATAELTLREAGVAPLVLSLHGRLAGETARVAVRARGGLGPVTAWLPEPGRPALVGPPLSVGVDLDLDPAGPVTARGSVTLGDVLAASGEATLRDGVLRLLLPRAAADLDLAASVAGLGWKPAGQMEVDDLVLTWRVGSGVPPTVRAVARVRALALPPASVGAEVAAERVEGRLTLEPGEGGLVLSGDIMLARARAAAVTLAPVESRYRVLADARGGVLRAELLDLSGRLDGVLLRGAVAYDGATGRVDGELRGEDVDVAPLVRRLAPGALAAGDRLTLRAPRAVVTGLDPRALTGGTGGTGERAGTPGAGGAARLEAGAARLVRVDGELGSDALTVQAELTPRGGVRLALDARGLSSTLPALRGEVAAAAVSADLARGPAGELAPAGAALTLRDPEGRDLLVAGLRRTAAGRMTLAARVPDLARLDRLWPDVPRRVNGTASLDVELSGSSFETADGRLVLSVPEGELLGGKVSLRDLRAELPVRRGSAVPGEPPWGTLEVAELIGYGVVVRDVTTPARIWRDRLHLNDLAYALYAGDGGGWSEVALAPAGLEIRGKLTASGVRIEEFVSAYGIRGGTMTGLLRYDVDYQYRAGRFAVKGRFEVPAGGTVNIELLNRLLRYAEGDPTGVVLPSALESLRTFDYKRAEAEVRSAERDILIDASLKGRERFLIFPPRVPEINIRNMPLGFLATQFPGT